MTVVERLEGAIAKLEQLKADSLPGPWFITYERERWPRVWGNSDGQDADQVAKTHHRGDADLIVTLHRTIDAQLAILKAAREDFAKFGRKPSEFFDNDLALADAILGDNS